MEQRIYIAVTGTKHYYGTAFLKPGLFVRLTKDPDNRHDHEAIRVDLDPLGKIGYVANSTHTVPKGCRSAGRIYDTFEQPVNGIVRFVVHDTVIVELMPDIQGMIIVQSKANISFEGLFRA